jgi:hypothetical protein
MRAFFSVVGAAALALVACAVGTGLDEEEYVPEALEGGAAAAPGAAGNGAGGAATGGGPGTGGVLPTGGVPGSGGVAMGGTGVSGGGEAGAGAGCATGTKSCGGICIPPTFGTGCTLDTCDACPPPPVDSQGVCNADQCDFICRAGYVRNLAGTGCEPEGGGGGGSAGAGGTAAGGMPAIGGASGMGGTPATGGTVSSGGVPATGGTPSTGGSPPTGCNASLCPSCGGGPCCTISGNCGCFYVWCV